jgi:hydroxymethylpyrimidine pyrophosphatase-like HAD family hydrolase
MAETSGGHLPARRVRILALDIDGTTIRDDGTISGAVVDAVARAQALGVHVVLCTGRPFQVGLGPVAQRLGLGPRHDGDIAAQAIVRNGAAAVDLPSGRVRWEEVMSGPLGPAIVDAIEAVGATPVVEEAPSDGARMFTWDDHLAHPAAKYYAHAWMRIDDVEPAPHDALRRAALRTTWIGACGDHATTRAAFEALAPFAHGPQSVDIFWSGSWLSADAPHHVVGIRPSHVNKAFGLARYAADLGLTLEDCVAVGDEMNDVEMVREVGFGVAMGQAQPALKAVARAVVASNEDDGVAEAIERFVLPYA